MKKQMGHHRLLAKLKNLKSLQSCLPPCHLISGDEGGSLIVYVKCYVYANSVLGMQSRFLDLLG